MEPTRAVDAGRFQTILHIAVYLQYTRELGLAMTTGKTSTLTLRIEPAVKEALRLAAARDHRSIANMIEVLIRDHCGSSGIEIADTTVGGTPAPRVRRDGRKLTRRADP